jgi:hypothetical protein
MVYIPYILWGKLVAERWCDMPAKAGRDVVAKLLEFPPDLATEVQAFADGRGETFRKVVLDACRRHLRYPPASPPDPAAEPLPDAAPSAGPKPKGAAKPKGKPKGK